MSGEKASNLLIIFSRFPVPGETKTRLIPALGQERAAALQRLMTENMAARAEELMAQGKVDVEIRFAGGRERLMEEWLGPGFIFNPQGEGHLGARMDRALRHAFSRGAKKAVLVGTDLPGLTASILEEAFDALDRSDLVLGPAKDGGYYLIGLKRARPDLFGGMDWGSPTVMKKTCETAEGLGLSVAKLTTLADVDRPEDLGLLRSFPEYADFARPRISVVIPALNEAGNIARAVKSAHGAPSSETIVVDGGSDDATVRIAGSLGARVLAGPRGRAVQMNLGAKEAAGEMLLFLHGDCILPGSYHEHVLGILAKPGVAAGAFEFAAGSDTRAMKIIELLANFRARRLQMPYGDQAIFIRAETFRRVGGFRELEIMEDFELVRRLRRLGRIEIAPAKVRSSARRWERMGVLRVTLTNQAVIAGYCLGLSTSRLARLYRRKRGLTEPRPGRGTKER